MKEKRETMPISPERPSMDMLKMSRREVAAISVLCHPDLPEVKIYASAQIVDQAIQSQFPESKESQRLPLANELARRLGNHQPQIAASFLRLFYEKRRQGGTAGGNGDDGVEEPLVVRNPLQDHQEK